MKKLFIFIFVLFTFTIKAQEIINLQNNQTYTSNSATIYDGGGATGDLVNEFSVTRIKAASGFIKLFFNDINLPQGAVLRVFKGQDTLELLGYYDGTYKLTDYVGKGFTIVYDPKGATVQTSGWGGVILPATQLETEKVTKPESDCIGAIPLCSNSTVNTAANQYDNTGNVNDDSGSCYSGTGNGGSVWYSFTPQSDGLLDFAIAPTGSTDYDFVLWDITNGCANKTQVSCNFDVTAGTTGMNSSGTTNSEPSDGELFCKKETVDDAKRYAICINYYGGNNDGFTLTFKNEASSVNIVDNTPPTITNAYTTNCASASTFTVNFSEYIDCATLQAADFTIPGYTVALVSTNCSGGKTLSVQISVSPAMAPGNYNMTVNNMNDMCGNPLNSVYNINTTVVPTANAGPDVSNCKSPGLFGIGFEYSNVTLTASGGTSYIWSTGQSGASLSVGPSSTTTYTVTAITGSCSSQDQVVVTTNLTPTPNLGPNQTVCSGFPVTLSATGGGTYQWQSSTSQWGGWVNISGATSATYTPSPSSTIFYQVLVSNGGCVGSDIIKVNIGSGVFGITAPSYVCEGSPITLSLPASLNAYTWSVAGTPIGTANTPLTVIPTSTTTYTATSTTVGCTGSASVTVPYRPLPIATASVNPTEACAGVPVSLTATPNDFAATQTENFEASNSFTLINGANNKWYWGTAAFASGTKGLYIGTAATNNNYSIGSLLSPKSANNYAYKDYTISGYCSANLSFKWKCNGQANQAELKVWVVPTSFTPTSGTSITAGSSNVLIGGPYSLQTSYQTVNLDLSSYVGQTVRIVFDWMNTGAAFLGGPTVANPAASIDDIVFSENTTYAYNWTSSPAGFLANTANTTASPSTATTYNLTVTRCDGCPVQQSVSVTTCTTLPVELTDFTGKNISAQQNELRWVTESERNNDYFILERSSDLLNWENVTIVNGNGNSSQLIAYIQYDSYFQKAINYYRLTQVDFDGTRNTLDQIISIDNRVLNKEIVKITNLLGQEIPMDAKGVKIIYYSDGTSVKVLN